MNGCSVHNLLVAREESYFGRWCYLRCGKYWELKKTAPTSRFSRPKSPGVYAELDEVVTVDQTVKAGGFDKLSSG
jgi:hypothetical protein